MVLGVWGHMTAIVRKQKASWVPAFISLFPVLPKPNKRMISYSDSDVPSAVHTSPTVSLSLPALVWILPTKPQSQFAHPLDPATFLFVSFFERDTWVYQEKLNSWLLSTSPDLNSNNNSFLWWFGNHINQQLKTCHSVPLLPQSVLVTSQPPSLELDVTFPLMHIGPYITGSCLLECLIPFLDSKVFKEINLYLIPLYNYNVLFRIWYPGDTKKKFIIQVHENKTHTACGEQCAISDGNT